MRKLPTSIPKPGASGPKDTRTRELASFVAGAPGKETLPWREPHVRHDVLVQLNQRQPEDLMLKINWLAMQKGETKRACVEEALQEWVDRELTRMGIKD